MSQNQVFLSYAHEDLVKVREIYAGLKQRGVDVWFDKEDLGIGKWKTKIERAIPRSKYFLICVSKAALLKVEDERGFQDEELQQAYEIARDVPEDTFLIIPLRLEDCDRGDNRLSTWQQWDLFEDFEERLDKLAVQFGGKFLSDESAIDKRSEDQKILEGLIGKGNSAYYANDFEKALLFYNTITEYSADQDAWVNKGIILGELDRHEEALQVFDKAIELDPDDQNAWFNKGIALGKLDRHEEAEKCFQKSEKLKEKDNEPY